MDLDIIDNIVEQCRNIPSASLRPKKPVMGKIASYPAYDARGESAVREVDGRQSWHTTGEMVVLQSVHTESYSYGCTYGCAVGE